MSNELDNVVAKALRKPCEWGVDDCLLFAGDASRAITGRDPFASVRGQWKSKREAYAVIAQHGRNLVDALAAWAPQNGLVEIEPAAAVAGDIGILYENGLPSTACRIQQGWLVRAERGVSVRPTVLQAWGVR